MTNMLDFRAFGKNDIRGIYGEDVTEELFYYTGKGYVKFILENLNKNVPEDKKINAKDLWISVAKDARTHSETLTKSLINSFENSYLQFCNFFQVSSFLQYSVTITPLDC